MSVSIAGRKHSAQKPPMSKRSKKIMDIVEMLLRSADGRVLLATIRECHRKEKRLSQEIMELQSTRLTAEMDLVRKHKISPHDLFYVQIGVDALELKDLRNPKIFTRLKERMSQ